MADHGHVFTSDAARGLGGPDWLMQRRAVAAERFEAQQAPTAAAEEWRYSPISELDIGSFRLASNHSTGAPSGHSCLPDGLEMATAGNGAGQRAAGAFDISDADGDWSDRVAAEATGAAAGLRGEVVAAVDVVDGRITASSGLEDLIRLGVFIGPVEQASAGREALGSVADDAGDYFTVMNDAFSACPIVIDVPVGVTVDGVIAVRHLASTARVASFPRLVVRLGQGAQARVLDVQRSSSAVLAVPVVELHVGQWARLGYLNLQQHHHSAWQIATHAARVERDASLVAASAGLGGCYARTRADTRLVGRGARGDLLSAYFGARDQILDFRTYQDHAAADTSSNLLYKGAVADSARSVYTGLIRVRPDARGTNAFQTNRNLKLSDNAWAESVPNLEIENNDVRCSHASAVSPVDEDQVFYLESRGVPTAAAERLIVAGFFDEVIDALPIDAAKVAVRHAIAAKLTEASNEGDDDGRS